MRNLIFDYDNGDFIHSASGNTGIDSGGDFHTDMGNNVSMDMPPVNSTLIPAGKTVMKARNPRFSLYIYMS